MAPEEVVRASVTGSPTAVAMIVCSALYCHDLFNINNNVSLLCIQVGGGVIDPYGLGDTHKYDNCLGGNQQVRQDNAPHAL